ncbi:SRPBCC family protein [Microbacterium sp. JZ31]|uniref:SRPBCC family protein n=1 Tax=Microbacterium sp. JZ31 TaxID=1906274 RepID=UPI001EE3EB22|nr:SRPBCC family protein [Microbacterium sp. JZ31]
MRASRPLYVEIDIAAPVERVWQLTQDPVLQPRWDARFTAIVPTRLRPDGAQEFRYELALGVHTIRGTGVSLGERLRADGRRTSALVFDTEDPLSPLGRGRGYWRYEPIEGGVRFSTGYDYAPGWGRIGQVLDPLLTRRLVWWLTAWSFDRLRIWAETGAPPVPIWRAWLSGAGERPRARRCRSAPRQVATSHARDVMADAPQTLGRLG